MVGTVTCFTVDVVSAADVGNGGADSAGTLTVDLAEPSEEAETDAPPLASCPNRAFTRPNTTARVANVAHSTTSRRAA